MTLPALAGSRLALIGCGHIGGSLALALAGRVGAVVGFDADPAHAARAVALGIAGRLAPCASEAAQGADVVVVAVPVRALAGVLSEIASALANVSLVLDVGSTKAGALEAARSLPAPGRFVGCHPIAGTERSGPDAADAALFRGRPVVLTPDTGTDPAALALAEELWRQAGAHPQRMDAATHDRAMAAWSHLPHLAAFALAGAADACLEALGAGRELGARSLLDGTRVAASAPETWTDILLENAGPVREATALLRARLDALDAAIGRGDAGALGALLAEARAARLRLAGGGPP